MTRQQPPHHRSVRTGSSRGQALLLAAVMMIVLIIGSVTLLNQSAYTARERADTSGDGAAPAVLTMAEATSSLEATVAYANEDPSISSQADRISQIQTDTAVLERRLANQSARDGGAVVFDQSTQTFTRGTRIWQNELSTLEGPSGQTDWVVTTGAAGTRAFTIALTGANLSSSYGTAFTVNLTYTDGSEQNLSIYRQADDLIIEDESGAQCRHDLSTIGLARLGFSAGTINGQRCDVLPRTETINGIKFTNADDVEARLTAVINGGGAAVPTLAVELSPSTQTATPEAHEAIYSTTLTVTVQTRTSTYTTTIRVTPGLPLEAANP